MERRRPEIMMSAKTRYDRRVLSKMDGSVYLVERTVEDFEDLLDIFHKVGS